MPSANRPQERRRTPSRRRFVPKAPITAPAGYHSEDRDQPAQQKDLRQVIQRRDQDYEEEHPVYARRNRSKIQFHADNNDYYDNM
jgi:hypothetical protein